ncbi:hypothetical protein POSPLADRAFT_1132368 [Postia placenta MAD-698-R-SB12]|uniref:DH domain-containing protein n=1 Tax=Postia placenta MAD-698-R-SB12 TaxID=670580 RepID=A0A1X6NC33_9APHY|nr:hypothetical protein POSPLADRAFT_1132368 [Postia placenta MAD-698-R-SB12]OSX66219.1 hypothetical protein POSPLADRAFT_1132368 [Postia placenta MAD-698-R-SB12]
MASAAGRKKSVISATTPTIESPIANNTLLNKAASQSTSLYQQCSALRTRLLQVQDFPEWFTVSSPPDSSRRSTDPVTQLWDCFALGVPLCYLFNLLPAPFSPINIDTDPKSFDATNEKTKKRSIALFSMQIKQLEGCEQFTVTELWDRNSTDGFVKVVNNVINLVRCLPDEVFVEPQLSSPHLASAQQSTDSLDADGAAPPPERDGGARYNIVRELVETERKYVQDLEVMQKYSIAASQMNVMDQETLQRLFPGLNKLLNFQRKFLIKLESIAELSPNDQSWGVPFMENEEEFAVYEPYCALYTSASDIMLQEMQNLTALDNVLSKSELPAFLIKPVQRICKYPLLLESLLKAVKTTDYPFIEELKLGVAAAKRVTDKINEAQRRAENLATVEALKGRVEDWKGHHISQFGSLLLDDIFTVTKSEVDREYHVFLFEKIILCCKEYLVPSANGRKVGKSNSILKKPPVPPPLMLPGAGPSKKRNTPLLLKGRIFLANVHLAEPKISAGRSSELWCQYSLAVYWRGDDDTEFFTLRCRNEEQLKMWETQLNRLIQENINRRMSDRNPQRLTQMTPSSAAAMQQRPPPIAYNQEKTYSTFSQSTVYSAYGATSPYGAPGRMGRHPYAAAGDEPPASANGSYSNGFGHGPQGYPPHDGFDVDLDEDYEEYPLPNYPPSGRATPAGSRRSDMIGFSQSARTSSHSSIPSAMSSHTALRSQFSSTRLKGAYDQAESRPNASSRQSAPAAPSRSRSASQPTAYIPPTVPPPLPTSIPSSVQWSTRAQSTVGNGHNKRGSGSSESTGESSDYSPHSSGSPITPFGSSDTSLAGMSASRHSRSQQHVDQVVTSAANELSRPVKVKVHFHEDIFVIQVPRSTEFDQLVEKVGKKIRLCGPNRRDDGPLRVKYKDEDGDLVSLGSTEDVQMAFESFRPGNLVTLYVQ